MRDDEQHSAAYHGVDDVCVFVSQLAAQLSWACVDGLPSDVQAGGLAACPKHHATADGIGQSQPRRRFVAPDLSERGLHLQQTLRIPMAGHCRSSRAGASNAASERVQDRDGARYEPCTRGKVRHGAIVLRGPKTGALGPTWRRCAAAFRDALPHPRQRTFGGQRINGRVAAMAIPAAHHGFCRWFSVSRFSRGRMVVQSAL